MLFVITHITCKYILTTYYILFLDDDDRSIDSEMKTVDFSFPQALRSMTREVNETDAHKIKASITFLGRNITSSIGIKLFKFLSIVIPLVPTFALVLYNGVQLEALITRSNLVADRFSQVNIVCLII